MDSKEDLKDLLTGKIESGKDKFYKVQSLNSFSVKDSSSKNSSVPYKLLKNESDGKSNSGFKKE